MNLLGNDETNCGDRALQSRQDKIIRVEPIMQMVNALRLGLS